MTNNWDRRARAIAEVHHEEDFSRRWGVEELLAEDAIYVFSNWCPRNKVTARDEQINEISKQLAGIGIEELGRGSFPTQGSDDGYSCVIVFSASADWVDSIKSICESVFGSRIGGEEE